MVVAKNGEIDVRKVDRYEMCLRDEAWQHLVIVFGG